MKTIHTDKREIIRLWLNQSQPFAANPSRNFYFEGKSIYSYGKHFVIAEILDNGSILLNEDKYSVTTAKHKLAVEQMLSGKDIIFCASLPNSIHRNIEMYNYQIYVLSDKLTRARNKDKYITAITAIQFKINRLQSLI